MAIETVMLLIAAALMILYQWLFRLLPRERWQILAVIPLRRHGEHWQGLNLTYYGLITGIAGATASALFLFLCASLGVSALLATGVLLCLLAACLPAAKLIAHRVEKNPHGFTVAGASFTGILLAPPLLWLLNQSPLIHPESPLPVVGLLAAAATAYALGEGIGRLACLSFGCCYGKTASLAPPWLQPICARWPHRYQGKLKKITFAGNMENVGVIPVQALSCVALTLLALLSTALFLRSHLNAALLTSLAGSQLWRLWSETLRADNRGGHQQVSVYQLMALFSCLYICTLIFVLPDQRATAPDVRAGFEALWQAPMLLALQAVGIGMFLFTGTSTITQARVQLLLTCTHADLQNAGARTRQHSASLAQPASGGH